MAAMGSSTDGSSGRGKGAADDTGLARRGHPRRQAVAPAPSLPKRRSQLLT
eukprot:CAMPEP_0115472080 /NCGR_PEP_ID=MMETSP0271-20121206/52859_1 /TAXON_ID=71861 /ORGANISM="Scrippsiella trochoidea, Strain CCMP3099" /LENGTH=50 /DNA_ID=CAMNT_0002899295 /DNA_START=563 /DNA_END=711 /DNA_ORIENTATION=-